jgi:hypothetical protein
LFGLHIPPLSFLKRGGKGGESERKNKREECFFKPLKIKDKSIENQWFFLTIILDNSASKSRVTRVHKFF